MNRVMVMEQNDNVGTALADLAEGVSIEVVLSSQKELKKLLIRNPVPFGHKIAIAPIRAGDRVVKYGEIIGAATQDIESGEHVHVHNVKSNRMQMPQIWYR